MFRQVSRALFIIGALLTCYLTYTAVQYLIEVHQNVKFWTALVEVMGSGDLIRTFNIDGDSLVDTTPDRNQVEAIIKLSYITIWRLVISIVISIIAIAIWLWAALKARWFYFVNFIAPLMMLFIGTREGISIYLAFMDTLSVSSFMAMFDNKAINHIIVPDIYLLLTGAIWFIVSIVKSVKD